MVAVGEHSPSLSYSEVMGAKMVLGQKIWCVADLVTSGPRKQESIQHSPLQGSAVD